MAMAMASRVVLGVKFWRASRNHMFEAPQNLQSGSSRTPTRPCYKPLSITFFGAGMFGSNMMGNRLGSRLFAQHASSHKKA